MNGAWKKYAKHGRSAANFAAVLAVFLLTVCLFAGIFLWYGREETPVSPGRKYFFLVRECEDATASAVMGQVYLFGGAGYRLEADGKSCVALSCYFTESDAEFVCGLLEEKGEKTKILALESKDFYLSGRDTEEKGRVEANLETAETCARILYETANGLERTDLSQEQAEAALCGTVKALKGLRYRNQSDLFARWNMALFRIQERGEALEGEILFAKDLRYLQTALCDAICSADELFS